MCASRPGLGGGLPGGLGRAGHIKPLCGDPLACWLLHGPSCSLPGRSCRCSGLPCTAMQVHQEMTSRCEAFCHMFVGHRKVQPKPWPPGIHTNMQEGKSGVRNPNTALDVRSSRMFGLG